MNFDVCICTHNPRNDVLALALDALARQTFPHDQFRVWMVDNTSLPPLAEGLLTSLRATGIEAHLLREPRLGLTAARVTAIVNTTSEWLVFLDDDNVLAPDYLAVAAEIAGNNPRLGCFGGKLVLPSTVTAPRWTRNLLPWLAVRDCGEEPITHAADHGGAWEPPGAGAVVRRPLLNWFLEQIGSNPASAQLGRNGTNGLLSADDTLIMRGAHRLGLLCSYQPRLRLEHHLAPHRLRFAYLCRLLYNYGRSAVILDRVLGKPILPAPPAEIVSLLHKTVTRLHSRKKLCQVARNWGEFVERRRLRSRP